MSSGEQVAWGKELGRRFRDQIRASGARIDSWQLDELWPSAINGRRNRDLETKRFYFTGVLLGLYEGRPELGDRAMQGLPYVAHAWALAALGATPGGRKLLAALDVASLRVVGEHYPRFEGSASEAVARAHETLARLRQSPNSSARALGNKYVLMMSPGRKPESRDLGGVQPGTDPNAWLREYAGRQRSQGSGMGMFSWTGGNARPEVVDQVIGAIAGGVR